MFFKVRSAWLLMLPALVGGSGAALAHQKPPAAPGQARRQTTIGDVRIFDWVNVRGQIDGSSITYTGPNTTVEAPDKASRSTIRLQAGTITSRKVGTALIGQLDVSGNVRFRITQQTDSGERALEGTAARASFDRRDQQIVLSGGVSAAFRDAALLNGPGSLKAARVIVDIGKTPYRYRIEDGDEIRFTPKEDGGEPQASRLRAGEVRIREFATGEFQVGQLARFAGPRASLDLNNMAENTRARLQARSIRALFTPEKDALARAEAEGDARYEIERPAPGGQGKQTVTGTSGSAAYDSQYATVVLQTGVNAMLTDPDALLKPGQLKADTIKIRLKTGEQSARYEIAGAPERTLLRFSPKPAPLNAVNPDDADATRRFALGEIEVKQFQSGVYEPGQTAEFRGGKTTFGTADAASGTRTEFHAARVTAAFADNQTISRIEATDNVRFHVEQPTAAPPQGPKPNTKEAVSGTAKRVLFVNTAGERTVTVFGKLRAEVRVPQTLAGPGLIFAEDGDKFALDLATSPYQFQFDSPNQTARIEFTPRGSAPNAPEKPIAKPGNNAKPPAKTGSAGKS